MKPPALPKTPPIDLDGFTLDVQHYMQKEYADIALAAVELPTVIEWLNWQTQIHIEQKLRTKAALERTEARAYFELKGGEFSRKGYGEKATEDGLKRAVALDEEVGQLNEEYAIYSGWVERLNNIQRSLQFKLELVRSSEATRRKLVE